MDPEKEGVDAPDEDLSLHDELSKAFDEPQEPETEPAEAAEAEQVDDVARDELGRFTKKEDDPVEGEKPAAEQEESAPAEAQPNEQHLTGEMPPPGWSVQAKHEWSALPSHVREAITNREKEIDAGFQQYAGLGQFQKMAEARGDTLAGLVENLTNAQQFLEQSPVEGIKWLMRDLGVTPEQIVGSQDSKDAKASPELVELRQSVGALQQRFQGYEQATQQRLDQAAEEEVRAFAEDPAHKYFENVRPQMAVLMQSGDVTDLKTAYETACYMNPETRAIVVADQIAANAAEREQQQQDAARQARNAAKSISGDPGGEFTDAPVPKNTVREELEAQFGRTTV